MNAKSRVTDCNAGGVNALAGGGSLITFPSLIATGLPSVEANVTNSVSVFPGYVASVVGSRADLAGQARRLRLIVPASVVGGAAGLGTLAGPAPAALGSPGLRVSRPAMRWGVQSGDVTASSAVVWSKTDRPARMVVEVAATGAVTAWAWNPAPRRDQPLTTPFAWVLVRLDGADAVMLGAALARATDAPGRGFHWGPEAHHGQLPRGARVEVGAAAPLQEVLFGPSRIANGTTNLVGALRRAMATTGYSDVKEFQRVEVVVAPYGA